jgi:SAM-dependent methyltransferase
LIDARDRNRSLSHAATGSDSEEAGAEVIKDYSETDYRTVWTKPDAIFSGRFENQLARRLLSPEPGWFIDLGAGYGRLYPLYARPGRKVVLVDYAPNLIAEAARSLGDKTDVSFVVANAYHLPFRSGVFSAGLSVRAFHHMSAPQSFLHECARVLRPGAHIVVEYSNKRSILRALRYRRDALRNDHEEYGDLLFGTHPAYFAAMASAAGLRVDRTLGTGFLSRFVSGRTRDAGALAASERVLDALFGSCDLAPMSFADLVKPADGRQAAAAHQLGDILQCPACGGRLDHHDHGKRCTECSRVYPADGAVLDLRWEDDRR